MNATSLQALFDGRAHRTLIFLAVPMILANITTPLLGLVDTAVLEHMDSSAHLAGASIGSLFLTQLYWVCGFLRMSTTGLSAQAKGKVRTEREAPTRVLAQAVCLGALLGATVVALQYPVLQAGMWLTSPAADVAQYIEDYFTVRVWGAPAAMMNLALVGWLIGQQLTRTVMTLQIVGNLINVVLDLLFVYVFNWSVSGVALASIIAEYSMCVGGLWVALSHCKGIAWQQQWFSRNATKLLLALNGNMLLRNLALQLCLAFLTIQGARLGTEQAAVNAMLMQFFVLIAVGLDGVAFAVEALIGEAVGEQRDDKLKAHCYRGLIWSTVFAVVYCVVFASAGEQIINLLTDHRALQQLGYAYLPLMIALPLIGHWCFLFDGVYVGLTRSGAMRDSMIISALGIFFPVWWLLRDEGNVALWYALLAFLLARGITLGGHFIWLSRRNALICASSHAPG